jgi:hypothetical protein
MKPTMTNKSNNSPKKILVTVNLLDSDVEILTKIARNRGTTRTEVIRRAISTEKIVEEADLDGANILIVKRGQQTQRLILVR